MKTDLLITPFDPKLIRFELHSNAKMNQKYIKKYQETGLEEEITKLVNIQNFENIYVHISNKNSFKNLKKIVFYENSVGDLINNTIKNNFFWYNCFSAKFFAPNDNIFARFISSLKNESLVGCPSTRSHNVTSNLHEHISTYEQTKTVFETYIIKNDQTSLNYHFINFSFCLINIKYVKEIGFTTKSKYNEEIIIDYYYRLKSRNIKVVSDLNTLIFSNKLQDNKQLFNIIETNLKNTWSGQYLFFDDYKKTYAYQFSDFYLKLQTKNFEIKPAQAILYVTTPFNWINGMTKHVRDLIKQNPNKHIYVFETPNEPTMESEFKLNHFYNNVLINIEYFNVFDFNHIQTTTSKNYTKLVEKILVTKNISVAHIHILALGHKLNFATLCKKHNVKSILSIHDLYYLGAEYTQLNIEQQFDENILTTKYNLKSIDNFKQLWTTNIQQLFNDIDKVVFYTSKYYDIFSKFYLIDKNKCQVIEHGSNFKQRYNLNNVNNKEQIFNILYFGRIREEKGILNLINYAKNCSNIKIYVLGTADDLNLMKQIEKTPNIEYVSSFSSFEELAQIVKKLNIHAKIIPANWHEAFNFTLSEAILLGLYPIVYNFGALGSRLRDYKIGTILNDNSPQKLSNEITKIKNMSNEKWLEQLKLVNETQISTIQQMYKHYDELYKNLDNFKICNDLEIDYDLYKKTYNIKLRNDSVIRIAKLNKIIWNSKFSILHKIIQKIKKMLLN